MKKMKNILIYSFIAALALGAGIMFYSSAHKAVAAGGDGAPAPQAMPVQVAKIAPQSIQIWKKFSGHVVAVDRAEIRPQVSGRITEIRFKDGQHVEKDDVLILIDPRPYQAAVDQAEAALDVAVTQANLAEKEYQRAKKLIETDAIAQGLLDERLNKRGSAAATVKGAKALLESAKIDLDYAHVKAPIAGKISRAEITEGNLVQAGAGAPLLTSIVADDKMYVDFEIDERTYLKSVKANAGSGDVKVPVKLVLLNGDIEYEGVVDSFDNRIDPSSGTMRARAVFENKDKFLLPGMSVSILMGSTGDQKRIMVSERAIGTDQDRKFVYTVNGDNTAKYREVKIGDSINGQRVILSGLEEGEKIITDGLVRIRPGMPVSPQMASAEENKDNAGSAAISPPPSDELNVSEEE